MKLLAIETATEACSAALMIDGEVSEQFEIAPRDHSKLILGMADELLAEAGIKLAQLDALAFGRGPGSFTGVRIATGVIQGIAMGADLPVVPVSTLAALAQGAYRQHGCEKIAASIDARMQEVYWGCYEIKDGCAVKVSDERVCKPEETELPEGEWFGVGTGWGSYKELLVKCHGQQVLGIDGEALPQAQDIAQLGVVGFEAGHAVAAEEALPIYLRDNVAKKKKDQVKSG